MRESKEKVMLLDLITSKDFAKMLGLGYPAFMQARDTGKLPVGIKLGIYTVWRREVVVNFIESLGRDPAPRKRR